MTSAYFITGTDTDVGKTLVATAWLQAANERGLSTLGLKPVAAGCERTAEGLRNADALALHAASSLRPLYYEEVNPVALPDACSPHLAARHAGRRPTVSQVVGFCRGSLSRRAGLTLIEGAGGWRVPLNDIEFMSAIAVTLRLPVVLVVGVRLGCLNAAFLTAEAIRRDGLELAGWVANVRDPGMLALDENIASLAQGLKAPCLGVVPVLESPSPAAAAAFLTNLPRAVAS